MAEQINESSPLSPGAQLRAAREKAGLSIRDVADKLQQLPRQVEALENDDYRHFSAEFFCRSYLKTYGTLLGLDMPDLLNAYAKLCPELAVDKARVARAPRHIQQPTKGHSAQYWGAAATVLIMLVLWWTSVAETDDAIIPEPIIDIPTKTVVKLDQQEGPAPAVSVLPIAAASSIGVAGSEQATDSSDVDSSELSALSETDSNEVAATADGLLRLQFSGDCWVQVKDSNEVLLFADLKRASQTLELVGQAPFYIVLGYAPAVTVVFNGEPVAVPVDTETNSARFVVGQS